MVPAPSPILALCRVRTCRYRVLVPDLYKGKLGVTTEEAHHVRDPISLASHVLPLRRHCGGWLPAESDEMTCGGMWLQLMDNLDWPAAKAELGEAIEYLKSTGATKVRTSPAGGTAPNKALLRCVPVLMPDCCLQVGVTGFCMGGALTFVAAAAGTVTAIAPFYGRRLFQQQAGFASARLCVPRAVNPCEVVPVWTRYCRDA